jgi:hypothetical protein
MDDENFHGARDHSLVGIVEVDRSRQAAPGRDLVIEVEEQPQIPCKLRPECRPAVTTNRPERMEPT